jgi:hypothetical protein
MSLKRVISVLVLVLIVVAALSLYVMEKRRLSAAICRACGREIHSEWAFMLGLKNGKQERLCCAKCGILEQLQMQPQVASAIATDYATGRSVQAEKAVYLWNSDLEHCAMPQKREWADPRPMDLTFDRCFPSLVAFESRDEAARFKADHGGTLVDYSESIRLAKSLPANP